MEIKLDTLQQTREFFYDHNFYESGLKESHIDISEYDESHIKFDISSDIVVLIKKTDLKKVLGVLT